MKSKNLLRRGIPLLGLILLQACAWENLEELYPESFNCDTSSASYSNDVVPILVNNCYACHSKLNAPSFGGGLSLEDHQEVAADTARIIGAIKHMDGFFPMPRDAGKLDPCPIELIESWARAGAPDN